MTQLKEGYHFIHHINLAYYLEELMILETMKPIPDVSALEVLYWSR